MPYDVALRHQQALDPSALSTIGTTLHAITRAIDDCRNAGCSAEEDPAVLLLARHLGAIATQERPDTPNLKRRCLTSIADLRRTPALAALAHKGVSFDSDAKALFHAEGRRAMQRLAAALDLEKNSFDIRSNKAGPAVSGEITLHGDEVYVQLSLGFGQEVMFRKVRGRRDFTGGANHWASVHDLLMPDRFASRLCRDLQLAHVAVQRDRRFA